MPTFRDLSDKEALDIMERVRRQIHVHSILYYHLHSPLISDRDFDTLSTMLVKTMNTWPHLVNQGYEHEMFADWTGDTGMHLELTENALAVAQSLLEMHEQQ